MQAEQISPDVIDHLINEALDALDKAYAPYSGFRVGASLITKDDKTFQGANIENLSFSPTVCAERTAFFQAILDNHREFKAICIVSSDNRKFTPPCGVCRQVMSEFVRGDFLVILAKMDRNHIILTFDDIFPHRVDPSVSIGNRDFNDTRG